MRILTVSQRVDRCNGHGERRDALDQRWSALAMACGFCPAPVPNCPEAVQSFLQAVDVAGILLTGGNDLLEYGGDSGERDRTEGILLRHAVDRGIPLFGVCRGMQFIQNHFGVQLARIGHHVGMVHKIDTADGGGREVNSFHCFGARETGGELDVVAWSDDGIVEAVVHRRLPLAGIMWHPERVDPFSPSDLKMLSVYFSKGGLIP